MRQRDADVVEAVQEPVASRGVEHERVTTPARRHFNDEPFDIDGDFGSCVGFNRRPQRFDVRLVEHHGHQSVLGAVVAEDVAEARRNHDVEAVLLQRPHGMLAR